ncbi:RNA methyltransferase [Phycicoccus endophyticus]|uniref:RNA methyltransferase n=1 Tax=Phycicoccus endophyticus TaxID=1690220 RepID=A0A7G9R1B9_9MICO|nr:RNA methyltransferase [Phycicoccus endophyticus]NHI18828.1 RNA methyltransferase [Phycicoccus endophyticus]QNN49394.1 RNA methyltransferase [Phycicoccus endophyticus]GGL36241.1 rRNA methyltransferase [Phycicoccus endophyticus]
MPELLVTSATNPRLKAVAALRRRRVRDQEGLTVVDGYDELALAVDAGVVPRTLLYCPELMLDPDAQSALVERVRGLGATTVRCGRTAFEKVAYREGPDGFLAVVPGAGRRLEDLVLGPDPLVVVVEGLEKPGNLGSVLRSADAAGVAAVVAADPATDWGNPNVVRASKGTVFTVPVASAPLAGVLGWLAGHGIRLVATTPDTATLHTEVDWTGAVAVAVGTEKTGLTPAALAAADERVRIPMAGRVNSLNAGVSAAVVLYEAVRQRGM